MRTIEKIVEAKLPPVRQDVIWVDISNPGNPIPKIYLNGVWTLSEPSGYAKIFGATTIMVLTQEEYDQIVDKDENTIYFVK